MRYFEKQSLMVPMFEAVPSTLVKMRKDLTPIVLNGFAKKGPAYFDTYTGKSLNYLRTQAKPFEDPLEMQRVFNQKIKEFPEKAKASIKETLRRWRE